MPATLIRERLWHRCFPVNYAEFLRAPFFIQQSGRVLLHVSNKMLVLHEREIHLI